VVEGASTFKVALADGNSYSAELVGKDTVTDLAVLRVQASDLSIAHLGDSDKLRVGQLVIAIGSCPTGGNMWFDSYATLGGLEKVLPVNYFVPGCPPRPEAILHGVAVALGIAPKKVSPVVKKQTYPEEKMAHV
jgi:hypothetical protein